MRYLFMLLLFGLWVNVYSQSKWEFGYDGAIGIGGFLEKSVMMGELVESNYQALPGISASLGFSFRRIFFHKFYLQGGISYNYQTFKYKEHFQYTGNGIQYLGGQSSFSRQITLRRLLFPLGFSYSFSNCSIFLGTMPAWSFSYDMVSENSRGELNLSPVIFARNTYSNGEKDVSLENEIEIFCKAAFTLKLDKNFEIGLDLAFPFSSNNLVHPNPYLLVIADAPRTADEPFYNFATTLRTIYWIK